MRMVFADAGYWIAVLDTDDILHETALRVSEALGIVHLLTTQMVLAEVASYFASHGDFYRQAVVALIADLQEAEDVTVISQTDEQFRQALAYYKQYQDKEWSLVDCASFLAMMERSIYEALAYDHHFQQAGFISLMRGN